MKENGQFVRMGKLRRSISEGSEMGLFRREKVIWSFKQVDKHANLLLCSFSYKFGLSMLITLIASNSFDSDSFTKYLFIIINVNVNK